MHVIRHTIFYRHQLYPTLKENNENNKNETIDRKEMINS